MSAVPSFEFFAKRHWLTVAQLAAATGKSRRTLQWACAHGDLRHCHKFEDAPNGGPRILQVDLAHAPEEYRAAYAKKDAHTRGEALLQLTDRQKQDAETSARFLEEVDAFIAARRAAGDGRRERDLLAACIHERRTQRPQLKTTSTRTYYRLRERWIAGGKTLVALADQRALPGKGVKREFDEDAFNFFSSLYCTQERKTASNCYRMLSAKAKDEGWQIPSLVTVMRTLLSRVSKARLLELREGETARANKYGSFIARDFMTLAGNEFWVSDHCLFDVLAYDDLPGFEIDRKTGELKPSRLWLTTWMDERSRYITAYRVHRGPNAYQVMASFHDACLEHGLPANIRIDNGKEYRCQRFAGGRNWREELEKIELDDTAVRPVLRDLGITPHYTDPYNAKAKICEPWHHHWVHERFDKSFPGYTGSTTDQRPEQLAEIVKKGGLMKWSELLPLLADLIEAYHFKGHENLDGKCPALVRQETLLAKRVADPRTLTLFFQDRKKLMIGRNGVELNGHVFGLGNPEVAARQGEYVLVRWDRMRIGQIFIYEPNGRYICTAENNGLLAANAQQEDVAEAKKLRKRHDRMADEMNTMMPILSAVSPAEQIALQKKFARAEAGELPPAPAIPIQPMEFSQAAEDRGPLPFRPVRPAADGSKIVKTDLQTQVETQGTDSPANAADAARLPDNLMDLYAAG